MADNPPVPRLAKILMGSSVTLGLLIAGAAASAATPESLLSHGMPVVASSVESSTRVAANAVDGNTATRWASALPGTDPQWLRVDLGAVKTVTHVNLRWEAAYAKRYQIQTSNDGVSWKTIYSTTSGNGGTDDLTGLSGSGRYVRMYGTRRATQWGYSLWELKVYGATPAAPSPSASTASPSPSPSTTSASPSASPSATATVRFADDFNGTGAPDPAKWTAQTGGAWGNGSEAQYYTPVNRSGVPNAYRDGAGNLVIEARRESYGGNAFTSARLASNYTQAYGKLEIRARFDSLQSGVWPALWTVGSSGPNETAWPDTGELDMMEWFGGSPAGPEVIAHLHSNPDYNKGFTAAGSDVRNWNVYSVEWRPGFVEFKVNGVRYGYQTSSTYGPGWNSFSYAQGIRLNMAINNGGLSWMPRVSSTFSTARMYIDYVYLYA